MTEKSFKYWVIAIFTAVNSFLGLLSVPVYIMVGANITDYVTGVMASHYRGEEIKSYIGVRGIAKKIGLWVLVLVGYGLDIMIAFATENMGVSIPLKCLVSLAVVLWIICNEFISIIENLADIGTQTPTFLIELIKLLKGKTEGASESVKE
ncbi:MAG: phage holin family protein [Oscillospiraceae bacterium]